MSRVKLPMTQELLKQHISYEPSTGEFRWKVPTTNAVSVGDLAGHVTDANSDKRRVVIGLHNRSYRAGRLAWLYMLGKWPAKLVDHRDGDYTNQRWDNLRDVDNQTNVQNQTKAARSNKSSGLLGVTWNKQRGNWRAQIKRDKKNHFLGDFTDPQAAHQAYLQAKRNLHAGCTI